MISIHAPVKGVTKPGYNFVGWFLISIHAPVKGATSAETRPSHSRFDSNPRSREGSDKLRPGLICSTFVFQSTLPRRERPVQLESIFTCNGFQSTLPRRERQDPDGYIIVCKAISIHAPVKGATAVPPDTRPACSTISIHAPVKGATQHRL